MDNRFVLSWHTPTGLRSVRYAGDDPHGEHMEQTRRLSEREQGNLRDELARRVREFARQHTHGDFNAALKQLRNDRTFEARLAAAYPVGDAER